MQQINTKVRGGAKKNNNFKFTARLNDFNKFNGYFCSETGNNKYASQCFNICLTANNIFNCCLFSNTLDMISGAQMQRPVSVEE